MGITNFYHGIINYLTTNGYLDHWTSIHIAAGAFICKVAQWLGASDFWAVMSVVIIGILWELLEYKVENWKPYGSKGRWLRNTISDLAVEIGIAVWMVL